MRSVLNFWTARKQHFVHLEIHSSCVKLFVHLEIIFIDLHYQTLGFISQVHSFHVLQCITAMRVESIWKPGVLRCSTPRLQESQKESWEMPAMGVEPVSSEGAEGEVASGCGLATCHRNRCPRKELKVRWRVGVGWRHVTGTGVLGRSWRWGGKWVWAGDMSQEPVSSEGAEGEVVSGCGLVTCHRNRCPRKELKVRWQVGVGWWHVTGTGVLGRSWRWGGKWVWAGDMSQEPVSSEGAEGEVASGCGLVTCHRNRCPRKELKVRWQVGVGWWHVTGTGVLGRSWRWGGEWVWAGDMSQEPVSSEGAEGEVVSGCGLVTCHRNRCPRKELKVRWWVGVGWRRVTGTGVLGRSWRERPGSCRTPHPPGPWRGHRGQHRAQRGHRGQHRAQRGHWSVAWGEAAPQGPRALVEGMGWVLWVGPAVGGVCLQQNRDTITLCSSPPPIGTQTVAMGEMYAKKEKHGGSVVSTHLSSIVLYTSCRTREVWVGGEVLYFKKSFYLLSNWCNQQIQSSFTLLNSHKTQGVLQWGQGGRGIRGSLGF